MYFVFRILRRATDGVCVIDGTVHETYDAAMHHFHQVMTTYGYGNNENYDYVAAQVQTLDGRIVRSEVDNRIPQPEPPEPPEPEPDEE